MSIHSQSLCRLQGKMFSLFQNLIITKIFKLIRFQYQTDLTVTQFAVDFFILKMDYTLRYAFILFTIHCD